MVLNAFSKTLTKVFGSRNERLVKAYRRRVELINEQEQAVTRLSDAQLREKTAEFRRRLDAGEASLTGMLPEMMAVAREAMDRAVGIRNIFDPRYEFDPAQLPSEHARTLYAQVKAQADALEPEEVAGGEPVPGWMQVEIPNELYEAVRELYPESKPPFRARPFDVQLIGGMVLGEGRIAEMKTGEGKTIVAPLACYMACIERMRCHIVTVNDYLVQRDRDWVFPFYYWLGLTVGAIHPQHMQPPEKKQEAYDCDVVYGTNSEFGFDYLRDNMKMSTAEQVQKTRDFCIIDEVDSILIDEARTPLIISGAANTDAPRYGLADQIARHLIQMQRDWDAADAKVQQAYRRLKALEGEIRNAREKEKIPALKQEQKQLQEQEIPRLEDARDQHTQYYEVEADKKQAHLTHHGVAEAQKQAGIGSFYVGNNMDFPHLLENALRAHVVYQRDKDYVVKEGEVVIVDENTGRLMVGRQWGDGLHQAVESKENVKIKQETQTLATVTIQNFFKLYKRLAGMTGTAITEANEFYDIYKLDVVCVPTNKSVIRVDRDDLIFLSSKDKWNAILDEIKHMHDLGRPVLVGTTSVEKSEMLSQMLTKRHGITHEVLNAKNHQREAQIIEQAGSLGAVMIATNMAGRGTDIRLQPVDREALVEHWQRRNLLPSHAKAGMSDEELVGLSYHHQAQHQLGLKKAEAQNLSSEEARLQLFRKWAQEDAGVEPAKAEQMSLQQCIDTLDQIPDYSRHRVAIWSHVEQMGGLHIIGTERHESRRIDNQLRGRSGRQGDQGSSRFFISLEDDLMKLFAGKTTLTALSKMGMKEGDAIEHKWVTRSVERAQRKVEERNYQIRKQLLDYDEVMEHQRNSFYTLRQQVLEGRGVNELIFDYIAEAVDDAVNTYKAPDYVQTQVAEWVRHTLEVSIEPGKLHLDDLEELESEVRKQAENEIEQNVDVTIGEYMSNDTPPEEWDLAGLSQWAMSRFSVDLKQNQLREMNVDQVKELLTREAKRQFAQRDLSELGKFMDKLYGDRELAEWVNQKFEIELEPEHLAKLEPEDAADEILEKARSAYRRREVTYPVDFVLDMVFQGAQQDRDWAVNQLLGWLKRRYEVEWTAEEALAKSGGELREALTAEAERWLEGGALEEQARQKVREYAGDMKGLAHWLRQRFGAEMMPEELEQTEDLEELIVRKGREALRIELTQLERFVLLQILDQAWKDHLYGMDQLKDAIGLRGFAQKDPRIEYKREGANQFAEMQQRVRDRVTELIFRARLAPNVRLRSAYGQEQQASHAEARAAVGAGAPAGQAEAAESDDQQSARPADSNLSRHQRRANEARQRDRAKGSMGPRKQRRKKSR